VALLRHARQGVGRVGLSDVMRVWGALATFERRQLCSACGGSDLLCGVVTVGCTGERGSASNLGCGYVRVWVCVGCLVSPAFLSSCLSDVWVCTGVGVRGLSCQPCVSVFMSLGCRNAVVG
jgi:hypothetical protein